jgi:dihydropyrimidine dehydrogenase (NAD+) subunit PreA
VKPIALNMVQQIMSDRQSVLPLSAIGGIGSWQDAAEFTLLGAGTVQVCTAVMHYGYRIVEDMADGLLVWMRSKGFETLDDFRGRTVSKVTEWKHLNLNYKIVARIHEELCIGCELCYTACWDGAHQCIHLDRALPAPDTSRTPAMVTAESLSRISMTPIAKLDLGGASETGPARTPLSRIPRVDEHECVGCNLCSLVCPVPDCITMERVDSGLPPETWDERMSSGLTQAVPSGHKH